MTRPEVRRLVATAVIVALVGAVPAAAQEAVTAPVAPTTYLDLYNTAVFRGTDLPDPAVLAAFVGITGDPAVDSHIRDLAEARGYRPQPFATAGLVPVDGRWLQASAVEGWLALKKAAMAEGVSLVLTSGHRSPEEQRALFVGRLRGSTSDDAIEVALRFAAPPGYSRHHSGFAIDLGDGGSTQEAFVGTAAYAWLSASDFARAKSAGFVPSYPEGGERMGPEPEPWELVWVGPGRIACSVHALSGGEFCDVAGSAWADDIAWLAELGVTVGCRPGRFCPDDPITRGEAASMLWRLYGAPTPRRAPPFRDVYADDHFAAAVAWLWSLGVVEGTSAVTYSPDAFLAPLDALALVVRLGETGTPAPGAVIGMDPAPGPRGDVGMQLGRGEFAALLRRLG